MNQQDYKHDIESLKALSREGELSPLRQEVLKGQLMSRLSAPAESGARVPARLLWGQERASLAYAVVPAFLVFMLMGGTVFASYGALPGETLYPVKRLTEQVEFTLAVSEQAKVEVQAKHAEERLEEIVKLDQKIEVQSVPEDKAEVEEHREEAKAETRTELETALNTLTEVQVKLETKGNNEAATNIKNVIQNLKDRAAPTFRVEVESEDHGRVKVRFPNLPSWQDRRNRNRGSDQWEQFDDSREQYRQNEDLPDGANDGSRRWPESGGVQSSDGSQDGADNASTPIIESPSVVEVGGEPEASVEIDAGTGHDEDEDRDSRWRDDD